MSYVMCVCVEWVGLCVLVGGVYGLGQRERRAYPYPITPLQNTWTQISFVFCRVCRALLLYNFNSTPPAATN